MSIKDDANGYRTITGIVTPYGSYDLTFYRGFASAVYLWPDGRGPGMKRLDLYLGTDVYDLPLGKPDPLSTMTITGGPRKLDVQLKIDNEPEPTGMQIKQFQLVLRPVLATDGADSGSGAAAGALPADGAGRVVVTTDPGGWVQQVDTELGPTLAANDERPVDDGSTGTPTTTTTLVIVEDAMTCPPICGTGNGGGLPLPVPDGDRR